MDSVITFVAKYVVFGMALVLAVVWLRERVPGKVALAVAAVVGLLLALLFMTVAGHVHTDPRPFVQNPSLHPLIKHAADNGFPSDHSVAAGLLATLAIWRDRLIGLVMIVAAVLVAASRVAAHVHHVQDVAAGLVLGALAAVLGVLVCRLALLRLGHRIFTRATR